MTANAQTPADVGAVAPTGTLLSVSASAEASRVPDVATISTGVVTQAADANTAMRDNASQMDKVMAAHPRGRDRRARHPDQRHQPQSAVQVRGEPAAGHHRLPGQQHRQREGARHRPSWARCWMRWSRRAPTRSTAPASSIDKPDAALRRGPHRRAEEGAGAARRPMPTRWACRCGASSASAKAAPACRARRCRCCGRCPPMPVTPRKPRWRRAKARCRSTWRWCSNSAAEFPGTPAPTPAPARASSFLRPLNALQRRRGARLRIERAPAQRTGVRRPGRNPTPSARPLHDSWFPLPHRKGDWP